VRGPGTGVNARGAQDPCPEFVDKANFLCDRNESIGRHHSMAQMAPPNQRLRTARLAGGDIDDWLIVQIDLTQAQGAAQIGLERGARSGFLLERRLKETILAAAIGFGAIEPCSGASAIPSRDDDLMTFELERRGDNIANPAGERNRRLSLSP